MNGIKVDESRTWKVRNCSLMKTEIENKERSCRRVEMFVNLFDDEMKIRTRGRRPFKYSNFVLSIGNEMMVKTICFLQSKSYLPR